MDQKKFSAVFDRSIPENLKNIQSFRGFANNYKRFIQDFSKLAAPLNALVFFFFFQWGLEQQKTFDSFKIAFTTAPTLLHYGLRQINNDKNRRFRLCDRRIFFFNTMI